MIKMQDSEPQLKANDKNEQLLSDFAVTRRQSRSLYRNWAVISRRSIGNSLQSQTNVFAKISTSSIGNDCVEYSRDSSNTFMEDRADEIVRHIEQTNMLMDVNPKLNNDRIESLREMTEYLTLKRSVKRKLTKSMGSTNKTLSFFKRLYYTISLFLFKIPVSIKCFISSFELWYSSLKVIEGHFGSNVASYFKFLRKLFILNACIFILMLFFIMIPQLLFRLFQYVDDNQNSKSVHNLSNKINQSNFFNEKLELLPLVMAKANPYKENDAFRVGNLFTGELEIIIFFPSFVFLDVFNSFSNRDNVKAMLNQKFLSLPLLISDHLRPKFAEAILAFIYYLFWCWDDMEHYLTVIGPRNPNFCPGFLTNTILFYGYYTNTSLQLIKEHSYSIPAAYFFTSVVCYTIIFFFLFTSVAVSYRKCYIETSGDTHNTFTNKVFCGWDFGIATKQAADLKSKSIYIEIKELLDDLSQPTKKKTCMNTFYTTAISFSLNGLLLFLLGLGGMYSWKYLDQQMTKADTATTMMMWLILTLVIAVAPVLFSLIAQLEGFESPSSALYMTLIRTFTLYAIVIAVVVAYRLNRSNESECWETVLGQDMFRLVVLDFIFGSVGTALSEFIRYRIYIKMWTGIGCPEFDIARSTMNLIYNQTLFYVGLFFSPVLSLLITVKLFIIFYVKKWGAIYNCKPFVKPWRASQAHTVYLSIAFFAFFCVVIAYGYIITSVKTSLCGPFRGGRYMYERLLEEILSNKNSSILMALYYITRPGVVGIVLMAMVLGVYYMRAVALARIHVVKHLRYLLRLKAEDRKLLLNEISKYTRNQDPPDDPDPAAFMSPNLNCLSENSPNYERTQNNEPLKMMKFVFSSMSNLLCEHKTSANRSSIFNCVQNISNCDTRGSMELHDNFNQSQNYQNETFKENLQEGTQTFMLKRDTSFDYSSSNISEVHQDQDAGASCEDSFNTYHGVSQLNFNPVYTESIPFNSEKVDYVDGSNTNNLIKKSCSSSEEEKFLTEQNKDLIEQNYFKNYCRGENRVPSRISFISDRKKSVGKKQK